MSRRRSCADDTFDTPNQRVIEFPSDLYEQDNAGVAFPGLADHDAVVDFEKAVDVFEMLRACHSWPSKVALGW